MFNDISPYIFDNHYKNIQPGEQAYIIFFRNNSVLVKICATHIEIPTLKDTYGICDNFTYLFSVSDKEFFLADDKSDVSSLIQNGYEFFGISKLRGCEPKWLCFAAATACQLGEWYDSNRFCGRCGESLHHSEKERMLYCDSCGYMVYPKISPAVIVGIINQNKILMTKYAANPNAERYALIAGFAEVGEPIEDTVRREVMEEVGLCVKNIQYYKSQPWAFSDTLLMGFFCELDGDDKITLDESELALAEWFERDKIPNSDDGISLTNEMMQQFKRGNI